MLKFQLITCVITLHIHFTCAFLPANTEPTSPTTEPSFSIPGFSSGFSTFGSPSTEPQSPLITEVIQEIDLGNYRLYPNSPPFFKEVELSTARLVNYVALFTDWWKKRPTEIIVFKINPNGGTDQVGYWSSSTYNSTICGDWQDLNVKCSYPDNNTARILVKLDDFTLSQNFLVRISGLLNDRQSFAILKKLQFLR